MRLLFVVPPRAYRWNFITMGADIALYNLALTFASIYGVLPLFVHHLTRSQVALGLIPAVAAIGSYLPPILVAPLLQRHQRRKPFILTSTVIERLPFLALALLTPTLAPARPMVLLWFFFALFALSMAAGGGGAVPWLDFVARVLPDDWRGRFFGLWRALGTLLGLVGGVATAALLRARAWPTGFALCFGAAFVGLALAYTFLALAREAPVPPARPATEEPPSVRRWRAYVVLLRRDPNFVAYLAATSLVTLSGLALAFYTVDAKSTLGLTDAGAGLYVVILTGGMVAGNILWGHLGDHGGHKRVLEGGAACLALAAGAALASHAAARSPLGVLTYGLAFALAGLSTSAVLMAGTTFVLDFGSEVDRPAYLGLAALGQLPFACLGPLLGGAIADRLGDGAIFVLSLVLGLTGAGVVRCWVRDPRRGVAL